jgi:hypothetical protein
MATEAHLSSLETNLVALIDERIARAFEQRNAPTLYSTERPEMWPPKCRSRRAARDRIRAVPEHVREGSGPATVWRVNVEAYRAHYMHRRAPIVQLLPTETDEILAARALAAAGLRSTRRSA